MALSQTEVLAGLAEIVNEETGIVKLLLTQIF